MKEKEVENLIRDTLSSEKPDRRVLTLAQNEMEKSNRVKPSTFISKRKTWYAVVGSLAAGFLMIIVAIPLLINSTVGDGGAASLAQSNVFYPVICLGLLGAVFAVAFIAIILKLHKHRRKK